jgi:PKD repeat protein
MYSTTDSLCTETQSMVVSVDSCLAYADFDNLVIELSAGFYPLYPVDTIGYILTWYFGDGTTSNDFEPNHTYPAPGQYTVSFVVENPNDPSCRDSASVTITTWECLADASFNMTSTNLTSFTFDMYNMTGLPDYIINWEFGDGTTTYGASQVSHTYNAPGAYMVTGAVHDGLQPNCNDYITQIACALDASFTYQPFDLYVGFSTDYYYELASGGYYVYWTMGDGMIITNNLYPAYTYAAPGTYTVTLTIYSNYDFNCFATYTEVITVTDCSLTADYTYTQDNLTMTFNSAFNPLDVLIEWDFGDGNTQTGVASVAHEYAAWGTYTVCLTVTEISDPTCTSQVCNDVVVQEQGIDDAGSGDLTWFPNPVGNTLYISSDGPVTHALYQIYNTLGQMVMTGTIDDVQTAELNVSALTKGSYYFVLSGNNGTRSAFMFIK